ncbi:hypothetical protein [Actinomyces howellii]|uniref:Uncharacterized protein n=1 Tax=Actinomyces howellii TaxID=52771 RepID=A0A448HJR9_9ACTO|nr:hypothetical protein [Actinomyces howellii]VEG29980.1 Uncharacterised protein [Actinomyces howellii]
MLKRYLVVIAALAVPIILAVASQMVSAPTPAAPIDSSPVSVRVSSTSSTQPAPVSTAREVLQVPLPASTAVAQEQAPATDQPSAGTAQVPATTEQDPADTDEEVGSDEQ